jgi:hypothetical protein
LKPMQSIVSDISDQNRTIISLLGKINKDGKSDEISNLLISVVAKQNIIFERMVQNEKENYTDELKHIAESVKKPVLEQLKVTKDGYGGFIFTPEYKK